MFLQICLSGRAKGILYEDDGDGFDYKEGRYLLTYYEAFLEGKELSLHITSSSGHSERPRRVLNIHLLIGGAAKVEC